MRRAPGWRDIPTGSAPPTESPATTPRPADLAAAHDLLDGASARGGLRAQLEAAERRVIAAALAATSWNQSQAARDLGISRRCLISRMERYGLKLKRVGVQSPG